MYMWGGFVIKKNYISKRENYGRQKMNSINHFKKTKRAGSNYSDFLKFFRLINLQHFLC